jgi:predicted Rossmann-fold nucleotide-binding protein
VFVGVQYWTPLIEFLRHRLLAKKAIDSEDLDRLVITDSPEVAVQCLTDVAVSRFGLTYGPRPKRRWYLWE